MAKENIHVPVHVGIIMDGNRRWAKERNLPTLDGHQRGYDLMKKVPDWLFNRGVKIVSIFAFSTENWKRTGEEVNYLMKLIKQAFTDDFEEFKRRGYRVLVSGRIDELPGDLPDICRDVINRSKDNTGGTLNICLNYGGRPEIIDAVQKMIKNNVSADQVHEGMIRKYLYNGGLPDPDIIVRTSGEERISGFLLWQAAYSEFLFLKKYWPDFEESDAEFILNEFASRQRRFGGN